MWMTTKEGKKIWRTDGSKKSVNPEKSRKNRLMNNKKSDEYRENYDKVFRVKNG